MSFLFFSELVVDKIHLFSRKHIEIVVRNASAYLIMLVLALGSGHVYLEHLSY